MVVDKCATLARFMTHHVSTELDYTEQTSWMLFLKYLDDLEQERAMAPELVGKSYDFIIDEPHRWSSWAAPKKADGS